MAAPSVSGDGKHTVLGRAFEILDCFESGEDVSLADLARTTGLPAATVHRMLGSLAEWGAVERIGRGLYRPSSKLWRLGRGVPEIRAAREAIRPVMVELYAVSGGTVLVVARDGDELLIADRIAGTSTAAQAWKPEGGIPVGAVAGGLVLLSQMPDEQLRELRRHSGLGLPPALAVDDVVLARVLDDVLRTGVAVTRGSRGRPAWVAAPVHRPRGAAILSLALVLPDADLDVTRHAELVVAAAHAATKALADSVEPRRPARTSR